MKNKILLFMSFMLLATFGTKAQTLIISEVADPGDDYQARFVELYNATSTTIDFNSTDWYLVIQSNGTTYSSFKLQGTVAAGATFTIANSVSNFNAAYGFDPDFYNGTVINGNGDDGYYLYSGGDNTTGTLIDAYGVFDEDGSGKPWEYEDAHAVRNNTITNANTTWTASEWTITDADVADMTPGVHTTTIPTSPVISNIAISPVAPTSADAVTVSATITDDVSVVGANLYWSTTTPVTMSDNSIAMTGVVNIYTANSDIPAQIAGTTVYYMIVAADGEATPNVTTSPEQSYTIPMPVGTVSLPYSRNFGTGDINTDGWHTEAVSDATYNWEIESPYVKMGNYTGTPNVYADATSWYVSPAIDASAVSDLMFNFKYAVYDLASGFLSVKVSTNYDGTSDPSAQGTWTDLTVNYTVDDYNTFTLVDDIDLSTYTGGDVYIAFEFSDTDADNATGNTWKINDINLFVPVLEPVIENIAIAPTTPTSLDDVEVSAKITDNVSVASANLYWSLATPVTIADNSVAMVAGANDVYTATIPAQAQNTQVYYMIVAADGDATPHVTTSAENDYTVAADVPNLTITSPTDGSTIASTDVDVAFTVNFFNVANGTGDGHIVYDLDGGTATDYFVTTDIALTGLANGSHTVNMKLVDNAGADLSPAVTTSVTFDVAVTPVVTIHDIQYTTVAGDGTYPSLLTDQIVKTAGVVSAVGTGNYYIQDADGAWNGVFVYDNTNTPALGDSIEITCKVAEYNGLTELIDLTAYEVKASSQTIHPAVAVTTLAANDEQYEGVLITVTGATCTNDDTAGNYGMWEVNDNSGALLVDDNIFAFTPTATYLYDVTGLGHYSYGSSKIIPRDANDISETVVTNPTITITSPANSSTITVDNVNVIFTVNDFTLGTDGKVAYSIDGGTTIATTETSPISFTGLANGNYTVGLELVDMSGTSLAPVVTTSVSFTINLPDAINSINSNILVYPNPSNGTFIVNVKESFNLEVIDIAGKVLQTKNVNSNTTINIPEAGVYFLRFSNSNGTSVKRVIVK